MFYYRYSPEQLERAAEQLLQKFDPELLKKPKEYDVYRVIEECLGVDTVFPLQGRKCRSSVVHKSAHLSAPRAGFPDR